MSEAWVQISSGQGPLECQRVVARLVDVFAREATRAGLRATLLDGVEGGAPDCLASALLSVSGPGTTDFLNAWRGTVQWRATSPFRPAHKRRNWFVGVEVFAVPERSRAGLGEVRFEAFRGSGPGGQNVNKVATAVRVVHPASGLSVVAREERSQHANRQLALARLESLLRDGVQEAEAAEREQRRLTHYRLERGNPVRTIKAPLA